MHAEWEHHEQETLRSTPEGELWISVLLDAFNVMDVAMEWRRSSYERSRSTLETEHDAGRITRSRYRLRRRELERERRNRESQIQSCVRFFFDEDSPLEFICDAFGYPVGVIREEARKRLAPLDDISGFELDPELIRFTQPEPQQNTVQ
jgi:hypothetical protein